MPVKRGVPWNQIGYLDDGRLKLLVSVHSAAWRVVLVGIKTKLLHPLLVVMAILRLRRLERLFKGAIFDCPSRGQISRLIP